MEDLTLKLGLLMEAAQGQQAVAASALEGLRAHTAGIDMIVREEIRSTLTEELRGLHAEARQAQLGLRGLVRAANLRTLLWAVLVSLTASAVPLALGCWLLPSQSQINTLRATHAALAERVRQLASEGGRMELRHCGAARRLCVRVDRGAPSFGGAADYLVVKGY